MVLDHDIAAVPVALAEVFAAFPELPVYTMTTLGWQELQAPSHE
jgi:hypothetical protein